jgi:hypothetical protein
MGTVNTAAAAVDTAIGTLNSTIATLMTDIASARSTLVAASITAGSGPTGGNASIPFYEDPGAYIRAVIGQTALTALLLGIPPQNTSGVTVAGQIPSAD